MIGYLRINGKIGIYPEGTTLKDNDKDFNEWNDSFIKLAKLTGAIIQPISIYWVQKRKRKFPVINFGKPIEVCEAEGTHAILNDVLMEQKLLLEESKNYCKQFY